MSAETGVVVDVFTGSLTNFFLIVTKPFKPFLNLVVYSDYPPPPPPVVDASSLPSSSSLPPPPLMDESAFGFQIKGPEKTLEERRSSLDAEIDSLTSILADLESSSPYKSRTPQAAEWECKFCRVAIDSNTAQGSWKSGVAEKYVRVVQDMYERSRTVVRCAVVMDQLSEEVRQESPWTMMFADDIVICSESREQVEENLERWRFTLERRGMKNSATLPAMSPNAPVTGYKRMVIPTQPPLTATKKSTPKPQAHPSAAPASSPSPSSRPQQPVPASYSTASTPSQPTFSVQARAAQPGPQQQQQQQPGRATYAQGQYTPAQPRGPDFAYGPPQPTFSAVGGYHDQHYGGAPAPGGQNTWRAEPSHHAVLPHNQSYQPSAPKKTYITDAPPSMAPYGAGAMGAQKFTILPGLQ
ncbi:hypothetical protein QTP70_008302 [Hemibagrus guttatus]|uniref:Uncharacterized protein n=1 Tax=Hemibagrus guttatus TaxID=175788 RepID=A0AAE0VE20_9TELE|nr:hypothetical protein QTP70_008302 [Hemibagrus guttatus]